MKKALLFFAGVAIVASLSSCKKTYACKCTSSVGGTSTSVTSGSFKATKKDAEDTCSGSAYTTGSSVTCEAVKQ